MKYLVFIINLFCAIPCCGQMAYGFIEQTTVFSERTERTPLHYVADEQTYTTGGIVFTYPVGLFSLPPFVTVSIQPTVPHANDETFVAEVSANSSTSATIIVYNLTTTAGVVSINEAPNGSVTVYFLAVEDPV